MRASISDYLRECGYRVIEGATADDAWAALAANISLDIVFSEVTLPGSMNGFELARAIRRSHPGIDVILTTGIADAAHKSEDLCDQSPIQKPYNHRDLAAQMHRLVARRRSSSQS